MRNKKLKSEGKYETGKKTREKRGWRRLRERIRERAQAEAEAAEALATCRAGRAREAGPDPTPREKLWRGNISGRDGPLPHA